MSKSNEPKKAHKKGARPVMFSKELNDWMKSKSTNTKVQSFRYGKLK